MSDTFPLNMDFSKPSYSLPNERQWQKSPADGVSRIPLEREAAEHGHTTSFVKFEPDAFFPAHPHPQGEEIFVMEGVFSDETGDYPAGTYLRNPPGSQHKPFTREGCTLFVKLDQFQHGDSTPVILKPQDRQWQQGIGNLKVLSLHAFNGESTALVWGGRKMKCFNRILTGAARRSWSSAAALSMNMASTRKAAGCAARI